MDVEPGGAGSVTQSCTQICICIEVLIGSLPQVRMVERPFGDICFPDVGHRLPESCRSHSPQEDTGATLMLTSNGPLRLSSADCSLSVLCQVCVSVL